MKRKLFFAAILFFSISTSFAQSLHAGLKGGATINKLTGKSFNEEFSFGYHLGGYAEIGLGKKFAIQPEILFNQINVDTTNKFSQVYNFSSLKDVKLSYLSIPVLLNYKASKILTLQAGPQFGILINKEQNAFQNGKNAFKQGDLSLLGGVQLNFSAFKIYGRYGIGLNNLNDIDDQDEWKSQSIQLGIGLNIL
ncbi:MAG: porin family protein [Bacteroidota bacterium]